MLIGAAIAGFLLWLSTEMLGSPAEFETTNTAAYWAFLGLLAAAGLVLALAQIAGGWTKWGRPRITAGAFLVGFLPALLVGGWVLLAGQPEGGLGQATAQSWANGLGVDGLFATMITVAPAIALALGLLFGYTFDTTGARVVGEEPVATTATDDPYATEGDRRRGRYVAADRDGDGRVEDEPVRAERHTVRDVDDERAHVRSEHGTADEHDEEPGDEEYHEPDRDFVRSMTGRGDRDDHVTHDGDEAPTTQDTRETTQDTRETRDERRRGGFFSRR